MATTYEYNSFNQVKKQFSPDGGTSEFWYDRLGRLVASQNEEQRLGADTYGLGTNRFSYTKYDALGRITEVGEKTNASANPRISNFLDIAQVNAFLNTGASAQITKTIYDQALFPYQNPSTSRKRVSATTYQDTEAETDPDASYYSYDIMGNVKTLIQRSKMLVAADNSNGEKRIDYQYDLISGKVNKVIYQPGKGDQFIHRYDYDADNRIISVNTSRDGLLWQNDAKYVYHLHGPLARTELGDQKVQGLDYAYTLQGWLKGVNSSSLHDGLFDIGQDGKTGGSLPIVGRDAFGYMLDYYIGDYKPIGQQAFSLNTFTSPSPTPATGFKSLYNGNIGAMVTNIRQLNTAQYTYYHYDQLNRIKRMEALHGQNAAANTWNFGLRFNGYIESFTYDPNGNIKTLSRNNNVEQIDDLTYNYLAGTNKLTSVADPIPSGLVNYDIDGQGANNYSYDRIGNMTADNAEGITNISWTVYGKIKSITKSTGTIDYRYDASGNRIYKKTVISGTTIETYYTRDAQGNVMAVYEKQAANPLKWMEQHLYGSSRLGMWNLADVVPGTTIPAIGGTVEDGYLYGSKFFELSNHLGNVLVTVSDKKIGIDEGGNGTTDYFQPEVLTAQDYYSFGMAMPGRKYTKPSSGYRYGFNGKENDNEVKGEGNQQDYGMRIYDPRLAKFLSVDPLTRSFAMLSPYHFANNSPVANIDLDGEEAKYFNIIVTEVFDGKGKLISSNASITEDKSQEAGWFVNGAVYRPEGELGSGSSLSFTHVTIRPGKSGIELMQIKDNGTLYVPSSDDKKGRSGLYFTSSKGSLTHASGSLNGRDAIPISLDLLLSAVGGFPGGNTSPNMLPWEGGGNEVQKLAALHEILTGDKKIAEKIDKTLESIKGIVGVFGAGDKVGEAVEAFLKSTENKDKTNQNNSSIDPVFRKKGAVVYNRRDGIKTLILDEKGTGQVSSANATDTFPKKN
jgi:RHS repeat-associated protein